MIRLVASCLALVPGLVALASGEASPRTLVVALAADLALAWLVARRVAFEEAPGSGETFDVLAWLAAAFGLLGTTLLSCPIPEGIGSATPGRRAALVLGALVAAGGVALVLHPARAILRAHEPDAPRG